MDPTCITLKPYQSSFDTLLNPGRRYKNSPGTIFFYQYVRLHINQYPLCADKFSFRKDLLTRYLVNFQRGFYWYDHDNDSFIPILSLALAARCSRKIFENIQGSVYRNLPNQSYIAAKEKTLKKKKNKSSSIHEDAMLLLSNARKMHHMMLSQFCSTDRIEQYTQILKGGIGSGIYAQQEKAVYDPIIQLFPGFLENNNDVDEEEDDLYSDPMFTTSPTKKQSKKTMKSIVQEMESDDMISYGTVDQFPMHKNNIRWSRPRIPLNTKCFIMSNGRKSYVKLVQVLRENDSLSRLLYIFKSPTDVTPVCYLKITEDEFIQQLQVGNATTFSFPDRDTSASALQSDIFTLHKASVLLPHKVQSYPIRYFHSTLAKKHDIDMFLTQSKSSSFKMNQRAFFSALMECMNTFSFYTEALSLRVGWAEWVPSQHGSRWYPWQIVALLLLTNSVHDKIVCSIVSEMFRKYTTPIEICSNPAKFIDFLTSKAKNFTPLSSDFDPNTDSIKKGPNYCYQKASYIVSMSKQIVLTWISQNDRNCNMPLDLLKKRYCDYASTNSIIRPIPKVWLTLVEESSSNLFPPIYSHEFFSSLPGVGLKMRHLCAEAIYSQVIGPAIDCHCIRFAVEFGLVHSCMNIEQMNSSLVSIFHQSQYVSLNEIPATLSQVLSNSKRDDNVVDFVSTLMDLSAGYNLEHCMQGFLSHYRKT